MRKDATSSSVRWTERIVREETRILMDEHGYRLLRSRPVRRALVIGLATVCMVLPTLGLTPAGSLRSVLCLVLMLTGIALGVMLRRSLRVIADAPDDLLDERQLAVRNDAYVRAYRILGTITAVGLVCTMVAFDVLQVTGGFDLFQRHFGIVASYLVLVMALPSMVIAWCEPAETPDVR